jgi:hypothetical protein
MEPPPKIIKQPKNEVVEEGEMASVTVEAEGKGLTYQWYYTSNGRTSQFYKSSNKTATYTTTMESSRDGRKVYCVITDQFGISVTTETVTLHMGTALEIVTQPQDVTVEAGATATVTVKAEGEGLRYQWYYTSNGNTNEFFKSSNKTATYTTTMDVSRDGRRVYCVITDKFGNSVTTETVTLRMKARTPLEIISQPQSVMVTEGEIAEVTVEVQGDGLTYQWYYTSNGSSSQFFKSSNKTATYTTTMESSRDGRRVYCVITDQYGNSVTTDTVTLKME